MTTLMDAIRRAHAAKTRGGPNGPDGLAIAAMLPSVEELADRVAERDPGLSPADALGEGAAAREAALEEVLTGGPGPGEGAEG